MALKPKIITTQFGRAARAGVRVTVAPCYGPGGVDVSLANVRLWSERFRNVVEQS